MRAIAGWRLAALLAALLLGAAAAQWRRAGRSRHRPGEAHNPLESWDTAGVRMLATAEDGGAGGINGGPHIRCNVSALPGEAAWVEVSWSGLAQGARRGRAVLEGLVWRYRGGGARAWTGHPARSPAPPAPLPLSPPRLPQPPCHELHPPLRRL